MSGLEVAAGAFGVISLAIQIGDSLLKLKGIWNSIKDAPEEIHHLIEHVENIHLIITDIELDLGTESESTVISGSSAKVCLEYCKKAALILESCVRESQSQLQCNGIIGGLKAVSQKKLIERLKERLQTSLHMLMLSNMIYSNTLRTQRDQLQWELQKIRQQEAMQDMKQEFRDIRAVIAESTNWYLTSHQSKEVESEPLEFQEVVTYHPRLVGPTSCRPRQNKSQRKLECKLQLLDAEVKRQSQSTDRLHQSSWWSFLKRMTEATGVWSLLGKEILGKPSYYFIDYHSPVVRYIQEGNLSGVQELFSTGQATPFDREEIGKTLLQFAATGPSVEICKLLINQGAEPNLMTLRSSMIPIGAGPSQERQSMRMFHFLVEQVETDDLMELLDPTKDPRRTHLTPLYFHEHLFRPNVPLLKTIMRKTNTSFTEKPLTYCVRFALKICAKGEQLHVASLLRVVLEGRKFGRRICTAQDDNGRTLLCHLASHYSRRFYDHPEDYERRLQGPIPKRCSPQRNIDNKWQTGRRLSNPDHDTHISKTVKLVQELVAGGSPLNNISTFYAHGVLPDRRTPLLHIFTGPCISYTWQLSQNGLILNPFPHIQPSYILLWLQTLHDAGVDLVEYGRKEQEIHRAGVVSLELSLNHLLIHECFFPGDLQLHMVTFTYGASPWDWRFYFVDGFEDYFGEFWGMVDQPNQEGQCGMPGAWNYGLAE